MDTIVAKITELSSPESEAVLEQAASIIRRGGLVAFPTETVYGLGANAFNAAAARSVYAAKGRPSDNPLIVHIARAEDAERLVTEVTETARRLMDAFWPGPLTLVLDKRGIIPSVTSGGLSTVALRLPGNAAARAFIGSCGVPIAAPSANLSGRPSPTKASHVEFDLGGRIDMIIDGGASHFGLESTIVDARGGLPVLLRPGSVTAEEIRRVCGGVSSDTLGENEPPKAPGQKYRHYAPSAKVLLFPNGGPDAMTAASSKLRSEGKKTAALCGDRLAARLTEGRLFDEVISLGDSGSAREIGASLFAALRRCDFLGMDVILAEAFPETDEWAAVMNRLNKAGSAAPD